MKPYLSGVLGLLLLPVAVFASTSAQSAAPLVGLYSNADGVPIIQMIDQTKHNLDIEIYQMDDRAVREAIRRALSRGVKVRIVKEPTPVGAACRVFVNSTEFDAAVASEPVDDCSDQRQLVKDVQQAGGIYVPFNKSPLCGVGPGAAGAQCVQHGKIVISDGTLGFVSTGNFDPTNLCDKSQAVGQCDRDYSVILQDADVVGAMEEIVDRDVIGQRYDLAAILAGNIGKKLTVSPLSLDPLVAFIRSAQSKIQIQNQYLKVPEINGALMEMARKHVTVEVMVSSFCAYQKPNPSAARQYQDIFGAFDAAGVRTRIFPRTIEVGGVAGYLHAKAIVVDGTRAWVGSVNGSTQSLSRNREFGVFIENRDWVRKLSSVMTQDQTDPRGETWTESLDCLKDKKTDDGGDTPGD